MDNTKQNTEESSKVKSGLEAMKELINKEILTTLAPRGFSKRNLKHGVTRDIANLEYLTRDRIYAVMTATDKIITARDKGILHVINEKITLTDQVMSKWNETLVQERTQWFGLRKYLRGTGWIWKPRYIERKLVMDITSLDANKKCLLFCKQLVEQTQVQVKREEPIMKVNK